MWAVVLPKSIYLKSIWSHKPGLIGYYSWAWLPITNLDKFAINLMDSGGEHKRHTLNVIRGELLITVATSMNEMSVCTVEYNWYKTCRTWGETDFPSLL